MTSQPVVTLGDITFPDDNAILRRHHRRSLDRGRYERRERLALGAILRPNDRVLELGGGIGFISTILARDHNVEAVLSFDANPMLIPFVRQVHSLNNVTDRATIRHGLVSDVAGDPLNFYLRGDFLASSLTDDLGDKFGGVQQIVQVPQLSMSDIVSEFRPNILVCDIEGAEADLLPKIDLRQFRAATVEMHPDSTGLSGVKKIVDAFSAHGLTIQPYATRGAVLAFEKVDS